LQIPTSWFFRIIVDVFNLGCFLHIAKKRQIAKAAVYATLNTFFVIIVNILRGLYPWWIYPYTVMIYIGYTLIAYDRSINFKKAMEHTIRIRFIQKLENEYEVVKDGDFIFDSSIDNEQLNTQLEEEALKRNEKFNDKFSKTHNRRKIELPQNMEELKLYASTTSLDSSRKKHRKNKKNYNDAINDGFAMFGD